WKPVSWKTQVFMGILLFLYSSKPNLAFTLGVILLAAGAWQAVTAATLAFFASFVVLAPWLGGFPQGRLDYFHLLSKYNQEDIGPFLQVAVNARIYTNLQSFLAQIPGIRPSIAAQVNHALWMGGTLVVLFFTRIRPRLSPVAFLESHLALFLLFCPSVNATE